MRPRRTGFTLLELMAVSSIAALVAGASAGMLWQISRVRERAEQRSAASREAAAAIDAIASAVANVLRPRSGHNVLLFDGVDETLDERVADRLRLLSVSHDPVRSGEGESDVREIEFWLDAVPHEPLPRLMRRDDPTRNLGEDGGGVRQPVARQIIALNLTYFDGLKWHDQWPQWLGRLPQAVRIEVAAAEVAADGRPLTEAHNVVRLRQLVAISRQPSREDRARTSQPEPSR